jgi:hypothetical protein
MQDLGNKERHEIIQKIKNARTEVELDIIHRQYPDVFYDDQQLNSLMYSQRYKILENE